MNGSLSNLCQKYHLRYSQIPSYTRQILNDLMYLHEQNVVHMWYNWCGCYILSSFSLSRCALSIFYILCQVVSLQIDVAFMNVYANRKSVVLLLFACNMWLFIHLFSFQKCCFWISIFKASLETCIFLSVSVADTSYIISWWY